MFGGTVFVVEAAFISQTEHGLPEKETVRLLYIFHLDVPSLNVLQFTFKQRKLNV